MKARISIGITPESGRTDVLMSRLDRRNPPNVTKVTNYPHRVRAHNNITDSSFVRLAKLIAEKGERSHETPHLTVFKVK